MNITVTLTTSLNLDVIVYTMDSLTDEKFTDTHSKVLPVAESFNALELDSKT
jgi:hypothetical protein